MCLFLLQRVKTIVQPVAAKQRPKAPVQVGITPRMARMLVAMHNNYRRNVPGPAANMEEMVSILEFVINVKRQCDLFSSCLLQAVVHWSIPYK